MGLLRQTVLAPLEGPLGLRAEILSCPIAAKDFYSDLRESWERAVEDEVLAKAVVRFVPDVMTGRLKKVTVTDEDYRTIFFAMKRASERSGHDMFAGRDIPQPPPHEMEDDFRIELGKLKKATSDTRPALEKPVGAILR